MISGIGQMLDSEYSIVSLCHEAKLEFPEGIGMGGGGGGGGGGGVKGGGEGVQTKTLLWGGYGYFLEEHIERWSGATKLSK